MKDGTKDLRAAQPSLDDALTDAFSPDLSEAAHCDRLLRLAVALSGAKSGVMIRADENEPRALGVADPVLIDLAREALEGETGELRSRDRIALRVGVGEDVFALGLRIPGGNSVLSVGWERLVLLSKLSQSRGSLTRSAFDGPLFQAGTAVARGDWSAAQDFANRLRAATRAHAVVLGAFEDRILLQHVVSDAPSLSNSGSTYDDLRTRLSAIGRGEDVTDGIHLGATPDGFGLIMIGAKGQKDVFAGLSPLFALPYYRRRALSGLRRYRTLGIAVTCLIGIAFLPLPDSVQAPAEVISRIQRTVTAPQSSLLLEMQVAEGDRVTAGNVIAQFDTRDLDSRISQDRASLAATLTRLQDARARRDEAGRRDAELEMEQVQARIDQHEILRAAATLTAPVSGIIIRDHGERRIGATLTIGEPVVEIAGEGPRLIQAWVSEKDRARVVVEDSVLFRLDSSPDNDIVAHVRDIAPIAETRDNFSVFRVQMTADEPPQWSVGMQGVASIDHRRAPAAIIAWDRLRNWLARNFWI